MMLPVQPPSSYEGGRIERVDIDSGEVEVLYTECDGRPLRAPNDIVFDAHGGFWFTDHGLREERTNDRTGVFYAKPDGSEIREVVLPARRAERPRALAGRLAPLRRRDLHRLRVVVADHRLPAWWSRRRACCPTTASCSTRLPGFQFLDSLGVDAEGNVCLATLGSGGITSVSPEDGSVVDFVETGDLLTTNICFGGEGLRTAYITLSGTGQAGPRGVAAGGPGAGALGIERAKSSNRPAKRLHGNQSPSIA